MSRSWCPAALTAAVLLLSLSLGAPQAGLAAKAQAPAAAPPAQPPVSVPVYGYEVVRAFPHDPQAFTEGLFYAAGCGGGCLYESTGLEGRSEIRKERLETAEVLQRRKIADAFFGEGIVAAGRRLVELTWKNGVGFVYDLGSFAPEGEFTYPGEGWALTRDAHRLIMSDGTPRLRFLDPKTLKEIGSVTVTYEGRPVPNLNELEYVKGEVFANIWQTNFIARIDPETGRVVGWIDLTGLLSPADRSLGPVDVLNGIAFDAAGDRLFVTGKLWPRLFQIRLVLRPGQHVSFRSSPA